MNGRQLPRILAAALGFVWFLQIGGGHALNPLNTAWLYRGDLMQHWLGFLFFQRDPWTWPLGSVPSLLYPLGTGIGFTDSNPLLALPLKLFASVLPGEYQVIGLWLCSCFVLQGYFGAALTSTVTSDRSLQVLGGYLMVMSPVLVARLGHDTLCAHWLILAVLYLGLREYPASAQRTPWLITGLAFLSAAIHPYLAVMVGMLGVAALLRLYRVGAMTAWRTAIWTSGCIGGMVSIWAAIGYLVHAPDLATGFGAFSSDLTTFIDPRGFSRLLPDIISDETTREGFAFLGLGGLAGLVIALVVMMRDRPRPAGIGLIIGVVLCLGFFAVSSLVKVAGHEILDLRRLYAPVLPIVTPFRSSGRFSWPLHYVLLLFGIWGATRIARDSRWAVVAVGLLVTLQAADLKPDLTWAQPRKLSQLSAEAFRYAGTQYRHLALAPMQVAGACGDPYQDDYVYSLMLTAHRLRMTFNSGYAARIDAARVREECRRLEDAIDAGRLDPQTIYVVALPALPRFQKVGAACGRWDGNWLCVDRAANPRFATYLETGKDPGSK